MLVSGRGTGKERRNRRLDWVLAVLALGMVILPWYRLQAGILSPSWLSHYPTGSDAAPAIVQIAFNGRWWLVLLLIAIGLAVAARLSRGAHTRSRLLLGSGILGVAVMVLEGFAVGYTGWRWPALEVWF